VIEIKLWNNFYVALFRVVGTEFRAIKFASCFDHHIGNVESCCALIIAPGMPPLPYRALKLPGIEWGAWIDAGSPQDG
jgi:hypothetical protein